MSSSNEAAKREEVKCIILGTLPTAAQACNLPQLGPHQKALVSLAVFWNWLDDPEWQSQLGVVAMQFSWRPHYSSHSHEPKEKPNDAGSKYWQFCGRRGEALHLLWRMTCLCVIECVCHHCQIWNFINKLHDPSEHSWWKKACTLSITIINKSG